MKKNKPAILLNKETNEIQRVVTLKNNRQKRNHYQEFVVEGCAMIDQACERGWEIKAFYYNREVPLSPWAANHLAQGRHEAAYALSAPLMARLSDKTDPSALIAICKMQTQHFAAYLPKRQDVVLVLDEPNSPGNLGMVIRSAAAFGATALVLSGHAADEYDPKCIRASVGTFFALPIYRIEGVRAFSERVEVLRSQANVQIVASGHYGSLPLPQASFFGDLLFLILGNETCGVSRGYRELSSAFVQIPLPGPFTSLNLAAAASIFLYEIFRRKTAQESPEPPLCSQVSAQSGPDPIAENEKGAKSRRLEGDGDTEKVSPRIDLRQSIDTCENSPV